jgi:hypothetical protein
MKDKVHRPPCPKCRKPVGYDEANGDFCPHCEAPISWGIEIMTLGTGGLKQVKDKGSWSIRHDYCGYCIGWNAPAHPYDSVPLRKSVDTRGRVDHEKICDEHFPRFKKRQERYARIRKKRRSL